MMSLTFVFWLFVVIFAIIGSMRGWAKELLVTFAVILAIFIITVMERFVPFISDSLNSSARFWLRMAIILALAFFGYQTPNIPRLAGNNRFARERLQDTLLGLFLGAVNGYLIVGSIWYYMNEANYPFPYITAPDPNTAMGEAALKLIPMLPPHWLGTPAIYFAVAIAFVFVLVVFI
ncbi:MAG TPA: CvpA family protein [Anaerolineaceae bacterium]|nr:CvpA family protein [Anaerolineaceae bacterium]